MKNITTFFRCVVRRLPQKNYLGVYKYLIAFDCKVYFLSIQLMQSARYASELIQDRISLYLSASSVSISGVRPLKRRYSPQQSIQPTDTTSTSILECTPLESNMKGDLVDKNRKKSHTQGNKCRFTNEITCHSLYAEL